MLSGLIRVLSRVFEGVIGPETLLFPLKKENLNLKFIDNLI